MQWLGRGCQRLLNTLLLLQEGRSQWETVERKSLQRCLCFLCFSKLTQNLKILQRKISDGMHKATSFVQMKKCYNAIML